MISAVIDRFEGKKAVLLLGDDEKQVIFPKSELPVDAEEGDYLKIAITFDKERTKAAQKEAEALLRDIEGDF